MLRALNRASPDPTIVVAGGTGSVALPRFTGTLISVSLAFDSGNPTFDVSFVDEDGYGVWGIPGVTGSGGKVTLPIGQKTTGTLTMVISNCSLAGKFTCRIVYETGV